MRSLELPADVQRALRDDFLLFFTGQERSASDILGAGAQRAALDRIGELAHATCAALEEGDLERCAELMDEHWERKRERAPGTVTDDMDDLRDRALRAGGRGVISLGAGGGGFLLVYTTDPERTREALGGDGVPELRFGLDTIGWTTVE